MLSKIISPNKLVHIPLQVLPAGHLVHADNPSLQDTPKALDPVCCYVSGSVLPAAVIDEESAV